jgi:hypothetical protein
MLRLLWIVRVRLQPIRRSTGVRWGERGHLVGVALKDLVDHAATVDGQVERPADAHVVHQICVAVDEAGDDAQRVHGNELCVLGVDDLAGVGGRDLAYDVDLTLGIADLLERLAGVDVVEVDDSLKAGSTFLVPVVGVGIEDDAVGAWEVGKEPGTRERVR